MTDTPDQGPDPTPSPDDPTVEVPSSGLSASSGASGGASDGSGGVPAGTAFVGGADPTRIGNYRIVRRIGHGGMGVVYLAVREEGAIRQQVAVKVIRAGLEAHEVIARFERERQVLAALDHQNIARMFDAGTTEDGAPYLVMEYIEGEPLDQYCDNRRLTVNERLKLFRQVCAAVHHAHQNLIVHRDIKPRNILVTADGVPKLLDFGIAKLLNAGMAAMVEAHTETGMRLMTPEYASPEQVRGQNVTTATDIYSLGVVLFELLTGHRPYRLKTRLIHEVERVICEEAPNRPSTVVTRIEAIGVDETEAETVDPTGEVATPSATSTITPEEVGRARSAGPTRLRRTLEGDVDNIVLMAMRKEPQRRYRSAEALAEDINRHLDGMPVTARPDTIGYRASKFVRRHRTGVAAAALIALALIAGIIGTTWQARVAERERAAAVAAEQQAEKRFDELRSLANVFLFDLYDQVNRLEGSLPARELMVTEGLRYLDGLAAEVGDDAELQAELSGGYKRMGDIQGGLRSGNLGDPVGALDSYGKALAIRRSLADGDPDNARRKASVAAALSAIADVDRMQGREDAALAGYTEAEAGLRDAVAIDGEETVLQVLLAAVVQSRGDVLFQSGRYDDARPLYDESIAIRKTLLQASPGSGSAQRRLAVGLTRAGRLAHLTGDPATALEHYRENLRMREQLHLAAPDSGRYKRDLMTAALVLGELQLELGEDGGAAADFEAARVQLEQAGDLAEQLADADPRDWRARLDVIHCDLALGRVLTQLDEDDEAEARFRSAVSGAESLLETNPGDVRAMRASARANESLAEHLGTAAATPESALADPDAVAALNRSMTLWRALAESEPSHAPDVARSTARLGLLLIDRGRSGEGRAMLRSADEQFGELEKSGALASDLAPLRDQVATALAAR